jgi:hypothetical protein
MSHESAPVVGTPVPLVGSPVPVAGSVAAVSVAGSVAASVSDAPPFPGPQARMHKKTSDGR